MTGFNFKCFFKLNDSMISMISCFVYRIYIACVFKCQLCKSPGDRICSVLSCCSLFSFSKVSAITIHVHIQCKTPFHLVRTSSNPLSLQGLSNEKSYWTRLSLTKSRQNRYSLMRKHDFKAVPFPRCYLDSRDRFAVTAIDEKSKTPLQVREVKCN